MAIRRPLVLINGTIQELPSTDSIPSGASLEIYFQDEAPLNPSNGAIWINTNDDSTCSSSEVLDGSTSCGGGIGTMAVGSTFIVG